MKYKTTILVLLIGFIIGIIANKLILKDDRETIISLVEKHPKIFKFADIRRKQILKTSAECANIDSKNFTAYGDTEKAAKENCVNKTIDLISKGIFYSQQADSINGHTVIHIGHISNSFIAELAGETNMTRNEAETYMNNIDKILKAIPTNIPNREVLKTHNLDKVKFYKNFAKVEYMEDKLLSELEKKGTAYRGQF